MLVAIGAMFETGARLVGADFPEWRLDDAAGVVMIGHPTRLWALSPGRKRNGNATATVNDLGMRGAAPTDPKPAGRKRILVLGDSTFFGHGVGDDETFPAQLEARFRAGGLDVEILNGGVPGYSTEQTRVMLDEVGWSLAPDLLLLGNLWSDNNVDSFRDEDLLRSARARHENPLYVSYFFRLLVTEIDGLRGGEGARLVTWTRQSQWPEKGGRRVSLRRYAENLDTMVREAAKRGIGAGIVSPCNINMLAGTYADGASWDVFYDAQRQLAAFHHLPLVETLPAMRAAAGDDAGALFLDVMHPSARGHGVFAETAEAVLRAAGWPAEPLLATGEAFPVATLHDNGFGVGDPNPSSPQRNLFGDGTTPAPPPLGHARSSASPSSPAGASAGPSEPGPRWALSGSVIGGKPPYGVEVRAAGGAVVASLRLARPGPFGVNVRGDVDAVDVVVMDAAGRSTAARGNRGGGSVDLAVR